MPKDVSDGADVEFFQAAQERGIDAADPRKFGGEGDHK